MRRGWIFGGWAVALLASALPVLWVLKGRIEDNPMGLYIDPDTGAWTSYVAWKFVAWWWPIAAAVSVLAAACMVLNRPPR